MLTNRRAPGPSASGGRAVLSDAAELRENFVRARSTTFDANRDEVILEPTAGVEWSVGAVAVRLGIPSATLRTWDRRYGIGPSARSAGGHRRYAELDVARVEVMVRFTTRGVSVQSAARVALSMDEPRLRREMVFDGSASPETD